MTRKTIEFNGIEKDVQDYANSECNGNFNGAVRKLVLDGIALHKYNNGLDWTDVKDGLPSEDRHEVEVSPIWHDGFDREVQCYFNSTKQEFYVELDDGSNFYNEVHDFVQKWR